MGSTDEVSVRWPSVMPLEEAITDLSVCLTPLGAAVVPGVVDPPGPAGHPEPDSGGGSFADHRPNTQAGVKRSRSRRYQRMTVGGWTMNASAMSAPINSSMTPHDEQSGADLFEHELGLAHAVAR